MLRRSILLAGLVLFAVSAQASRDDEPCFSSVRANLILMHDSFAHIWCLDLSKNKNAYRMYAEYPASGKLVTAKVKFDPDTCDIKGYEPLADDEKIKRKEWRKSCDEGPSID